MMLWKRKHSDCKKTQMTGITRGSKESVFPDLNHMEVITTASEKYREKILIG